MGHHGPPCPKPRASLVSGHRSARARSRAWWPWLRGQPPRLALGHFPSAAPVHAAARPPAPTQARLHSGGGSPCPQRSRRSALAAARRPPRWTSPHEFEARKRERENRLESRKVSAHAEEHGPPADRFCPPPRRAGPPRISRPSSARWEKACTEVVAPHDSGSGISFPVTKSICQDVWIQERNAEEIAADRLQLLREILSLCKELGYTRKQCGELIQTGVGSTGQQ